MVGGLEHGPQAQGRGGRDLRPRGSEGRQQGRRRGDSVPVDHQDPAEAPASEVGVRIEGLEGRDRAGTVEEPARFHRPLWRITSSVGSGPVGPGGGLVEGPLLPEEGLPAGGDPQEGQVV